MTKRQKSLVKEWLLEIFREVFWFLVFTSVFYYFFENWFQSIVAAQLFYVYLGIKYYGDKLTKGIS